MEYGYFIETTNGRKTWFAEGCTYCRMSTSGQHELNCPLYQPLRRVVEFDRLSIIPHIKAIRES